ncbi:MAG: zinc-ribbon domain-containing protein [Clostridiales bacterium]|nr:zinc-ribbon domain-containing protein [Clostridiales bacterium]
MRCPNCKAELSDQVKYCTRCGYKLATNENEFQNYAAKPLRRKKSKLPIVIMILCAIILIAGAAGALLLAGRNNKETDPK